MHRFPAEVIRVDTSGRRFQRMCVARKSMLAAPAGFPQIGDHNNLNEDIQTVKRRSRSRKPRSKRRNTIAGTDQKEIEEAVKGWVLHWFREWNCVFAMDGFNRRVLFCVCFCFCFQTLTLAMKNTWLNWHVHISLLQLILFVLFVLVFGKIWLFVLCKACS